MSNAPTPGLAIVACSPTGRPRTFRLERPSQSSDAAYRRLASAIVRLDVASLATELRTKRLGLNQPRAA